MSLLGVSEDDFRRAIGLISRIDERTKHIEKQLDDGLASTEDLDKLKQDIQNQIKTQVNGLEGKMNEKVAPLQKLTYTLITLLITGLCGFFINRVVFK